MAMHNFLPPDFYDRPLTPETMQRALAVLPPEDVSQIDKFTEPNATFSLLRPLVSPDPQEFAPMQEELANVLRNHPTHASWLSAAVMKPENFGAVYFDGEPQALAQPLVLRRTSSLALAMHLCAAMPESATEPVTATMQRIKTSSPRKERYLVWAALDCDDALPENMVAENAMGILAQQARTTYKDHLSLPLLFIRKQLKDSFVPGMQIRHCAEEWLPEGQSMQLDRLRLRVHLPDASPYRRIGH